MRVFTFESQRFIQGNVARKRVESVVKDGRSESEHARAAISSDVLAYSTVEGDAVAEESGYIPSFVSRLHSEYGAKERTQDDESSEESYNDDVDQRVLQDLT